MRIGRVRRVLVSTAPYHRDKAEHPQVERTWLATMPKSPTCANCGQPMVETPRSLRHDGNWEISVFECEACGLDFFTEDHVPLVGLPAPASFSARLIAAMSRMVHHTIKPTRH